MNTALLKEKPALCSCIVSPNPVATEAFEDIKYEIAEALVTAVDYSKPFVVETDASDFAIGATLSQNSRPVAFFSRTLSHSERHHSAVEKEAYAIVESLRKWRHYLLGRHFQLVTDQKSVSFMLDSKQHGKIKNDKITRWRLELSSYSYDIIYRPGKDNHIADAFSRNICSSLPVDHLKTLHISLCHPGITRMFHYVRTKNLPYSITDIKNMISSCSVCAEIKPKFFKNNPGHLIKATQPFERLNVDFKGPVPSTGRNRYFLTIIDEFSRFPFVFPCKDMSASTVIECFRHLFSIFGMPAYIHSDRGTAFMSDELRTFLINHGVACSRTTAYNPQGNGQAERYNGIIWRTISLALKSKRLPSGMWESVLPDALHCIRSLLCTATNQTPHERMFHHMRKSANGASIPTWLSSPGVVLMRRQNRNSKYDSLVEEVDLIEANPEYAHVRLRDGRETSVSLRHLAPAVGDERQSAHSETHERQPDYICDNSRVPEYVDRVEDQTAVPLSSPNPGNSCHSGLSPEPTTVDNGNQALRRSSRVSRKPSYLKDYE